MLAEGAFLLLDVKINIRFPQHLFFYLMWSKWRHVSACFSHSIRISSRFENDRFPWVEFGETPPLQQQLQLCEALILIPYDLKAFTATYWKVGGMCVRSSSLPDPCLGLGTQSHLLEARYPQRRIYPNSARSHAVLCTVEAMYGLHILLLLVLKQGSLLLSSWKEQCYNSRGEFVICHLSCKGHFS